jgi:hypothetical protein
VTGVLRGALLATAAWIALATAPAWGQTGVDPTDSSELWATVNVCDTPGAPDTIGVRGSMPGTRVRGERMYLRIRLEYLARADQGWHAVGHAGDSGRIYVGSAFHPLREAGMSFSFAPPAEGSLLLRGRVTFEWRLHRQVLYRAEQLTTAEHDDVAQSDPPGFSAAVCEIKP